MININTRSVLRPEYLYHSYNFSTPSTVKTYDYVSSKINTNTAPVYHLEGKSHVKKLRPDNKRVHPYKKPCGNYATNTTNPKDKILWPGTSNRSDSSDSESVSHENSSSPSLSYVSRYSSESTTHNYETKSHVNDVQSIRETNTSHPRSHSHGQAEQIRRSRESITFALIDAQLSIPPLSQVRDMYLQTRSGCGTSNSTARTTKKANLSVVHTVVRFRIKEYLIELREHIRRSLDTLFYNLVENYDSKSRDTLATEILGLPSRQCSPDCDFCSDLLPRNERCRTQNYDSNRQNNYPSQLLAQISSTSRSPSPLSTRPQISISLPSNDTLRSQTPPDSTASYVGSDNDVFPDPEPVDSCLSDNTNALINTRLSQSLFLDSSSVLERPLPSYHINVFDSRNHKRVRLDSTSLRLSNEFDYTDWAADDIDFGPCGEELVDLHSLVFDSSSDIQSKLDETFFDPAYDVSDLMHHFTMDKYHSLQLAISP
ncbi:hypothetical protein Smp_158740 [Schistosoma mansoni]|uniref:SERTA domain-containing protein n=1 Tax=Schistosoma mansoni TaxID=6183 RepID=G4VQB9_SCHMA|nr:hypothetical protein Smp_158740 [Schistosoma mansoni]|eukprot:XP_018654044.1 hypothetical protein Smp_158740 [Schistosoma mansoni]